MKAIQDLIGSENHCHGCGPENKQGLRIKSYFDGRESICNFTPQAHHCAGSLDVLNGGIIASLIDCHSINTAMAYLYKQANREIGSDPKIWCVTGSLQVSYLKPTPISSELTITAKISKAEGKKVWISSELVSNGNLCAKGEVLGIKIER